MHEKKNSAADMRLVSQPAGAGSRQITAADFRLEDQFLIQQLAYRYALAVDTHDTALLASCFAPGVRIIGPGFVLEDNIASAVIAGLRSRYVWTQHNVFNPLYRIDGEHASGTVNCIASHVEQADEGPRKLDWYIRYHDRLVKQDGEWRLIERRLEVAYAATVSVIPLA